MDSNVIFRNAVCGRDGNFDPIISLAGAINRLCQSITLIVRCCENVRYVFHFIRQKEFHI